MLVLIVLAIHICLLLRMIIIISLTEDAAAWDNLETDYSFAMMILIISYSTLFVMEIHNY